MLTSKILASILRDLLSFCTVKIKEVGDYCNNRATAHLPSLNSATVNWEQGRVDVELEGGEGVGAPLLNTEIDPKLVRSNLVPRSYRLIVTKMDEEDLGMRLGSWQWRNFDSTFFPFSVQLCLFLFK